MAPVTWTDQALDDLDAICLFIARDAPRAADLFAQRVFQTTERLEMFALSGRMVPESNDERIREVVVGNYRIIHRILSEDEVEILTVHHGARLLPDLPGT